MRILTCLSFSLINLYVAHGSVHHSCGQLTLSGPVRTLRLRRDPEASKAGPGAFKTVDQAGNSRVIPILNNPINPDLTRDHLRRLQFPITQRLDDASEVLLEVSEHCS
jgi:hypothetical protein